MYVLFLLLWFLFFNYSNCQMTLNNRALYFNIIYIVWGTLTYIMYMIHIYNMYYI